MAIPLRYYLSEISDQTRKFCRASVTPSDLNSTLKAQHFYVKRVKLIENS
jgi:hypothetical protein